MRKLLLYLVWVCCSSTMSTAWASSVAMDLMDGQDFYQAMPRQRPLAEQFSSILQSPPLPIRIQQQRSVNVAMFLFGDVDSVENQALLLAFRRRMRELNIDYRLDIYVDNAVDGVDFSPYTKLTNAQPDYIVMTKLGLIQRRFVERFLRSGDTKVIVYNFASPLKQWLHHSPLMYLGFDQKKVTTMLADYLHRSLPPDARLSAMVLPADYLSHLRCDLFLDEMVKHQRHIDRVYVASDDKHSAFTLTQALLKEAPVDFVFSCSASISEGVLAAIQSQKYEDSQWNVPARVKTNGWGVSWQGVSGLTSPALMASAVFMQDELSIAIAEAIKLDLEAQNLPTLYIANSTLVPASLDPVVLRFVMQKAYPYSGSLWP
ncbi:hypothetical protein [Marinomonas algarum]|uniref:Uncharacterized protein n=1 Tax=Marinomonas algarum TaxID=2883105 RepID=A0A9X1LCU0_9GAMM|nr:hypothetical protein [Marinomonas algarum]MCB5161802.1 hypothetical protein [Marinomonas algarum]